MGLQYMYILKIKKQANVIISKTIDSHQMNSIIKLLYSAFVTISDTGTYFPVTRLLMVSK